MFGPNKAQSFFLVLSLCFSGYVLVPADPVFVTDDCVSTCYPGCSDRCNKIELSTPAQEEDPAALLMLCEVSTPRNSSVDKCICHDYPRYYHHFPICHDDKTWTRSGSTTFKMASLGVVVLLNVAALYTIS